jgi:uncharacterized protein (TIGR00730 family)
VFCGGSGAAKPAYKEAAAELGRIMAARRIGLVFGGGRIGLMGVLADAALAAGGEVDGVIPDHLVRREVAHRGLTDLRVVRSMHERKAEMARLADAFVALPGGFGTMDELFEMLTWSQVGLHEKATALVNVDGYWDHLPPGSTARSPTACSGPATRAPPRRPRPRGALDSLAAWRPPEMPALA